MWIVKTKLIPAIIGVIGTISKSLRQYLSNTAATLYTLETWFQVYNCKYHI